MNDIPAFPCDLTAYDEEVKQQFQGMTLRDYFAAAFVKSGTVFPREFPINTPERVATQAYELADAMLKARDGNA